MSSVLSFSMQVSLYPKQQHCNSSPHPSSTFYRSSPEGKTHTHTHTLMQLSCCSCGPSTVLSQFHSKEGIRNPLLRPSVQYLNARGNTHRERMMWGSSCTKADSSPQPYQCGKTGLTTSANNTAEKQENIFDPRKLSITWRGLLLHHKHPPLKKNKQKKHFFYYHNLQCATRPWQHHHKSKEIQL